MKLLSTSLLLAISLTVTSLTVAKTPNFILIYADDLGYTQTSVAMMKERPETCLLYTSDAADE